MFFDNWMNHGMSVLIQERQLIPWNPDVSIFVGINCGVIAPVLVHCKLPTTFWHGNTLDFVFKLFYFTSLQSFLLLRLNI